MFNSVLFSLALGFPLKRERGNPPRREAPSQSLGEVRNSRSGAETICFFHKRTVSTGEGLMLPPGCVKMDVTVFLILFFFFTYKARRVCAILVSLHKDWHTRPHSDAYSICFSLDACFIIPSVVVPHWLSFFFFFFFTPHHNGLLHKAARQRFCQSGLEPGLSLAYLIPPWALFTRRLGTRCTLNAHTHTQIETHTRTVKRRMQENYDADDELEPPQLEEYINVCRLHKHTYANALTICSPHFGQY